MTSAFPPSDGLEVSPEQTQQALADGKAIVVDVREQDERDEHVAEQLPPVELPGGDDLRERRQQHERREPRTRDLAGPARGRRPRRRFQST